MAAQVVPLSTTEIGNMANCMYVATIKKIIF